MTDTEVRTEADALRDILKWSSGRPIWQRESLRRLVTKGDDLTETDFEELTKLCKDPSILHEPLASDHSSAQRNGAPTVALKNLRGVQNVNALAENQTLSFIPKGVTIIYGDNGAGKSGYVRILKNACRARFRRGNDGVILPNIYENGIGPQRAELEFHAGAQIQKVNWNNGEPCNPLLSEISVFDSRSANVHVEATNDLAYTPYPMKPLERLVGACGTIKSVLEDEISVSRSQTPQCISAPACSSSTKVGKLIYALGKDTKTEDVIALATLTDGELARLAELNLDFAQDPASTARRLRAQKARLETLLDKLEAQAEAVSPAKAQQLAAISSDLLIKSEAAKLASTDLSQNEPLDGVGSESWRNLWEAAREYSVQEAYPENDFPVSNADALCVLCQQELDQNASKRLARFESFVQDRTQREEDAAKKALEEARTILQDASLSMASLLDERRFLADEIGNIDLAKNVWRVAVQIQWRLRAILRSNVEPNLPIPKSIDNDLQTFIDDLELRAQALLADDESDQRKALRAELAELNDRHWLSGIKTDIIAEIDRQGIIYKLESAILDTKPNAITQKNTALSQALITDRLRARFAQEIDQLKLQGPPIELTQASSQHGVSRFRISLVQGGSNNAGDVLSEGEYRCVALAGFMAELATNDSDSGIIFDDPRASGLGVLSGGTGPCYAQC